MFLCSKISHVCFIRTEKGVLMNKKLRKVDARLAKISQKAPKPKLVEVVLSNYASNNLNRSEAKKISYESLDEREILSLISLPAYELRPSSSLEKSLIYREHRIKRMLNITYFVRECLKVKQVSSHYQVS